MRGTVIFAVLVALSGVTPALADTISFFDASQSIDSTTHATTSDTITSNGYKFTLTQDKLFTGGTGSVIGRSNSVVWPNGIQAQAITTPTGQPAQLTIKRVDGSKFDIPNFNMRLLANTFGAGAAMEIMPLVNGNDGFSDPLALDCSGYGGQNFAYSTPTLTQFDTYKFSLYVDFAITGITFQGAPVAAVPEPASLGVVALGALGLLMRRGHRR